MPAVKLDISTARGLGYAPTYDLETGMATVWPDFAPEGALAAAGPGPAGGPAARDSAALAAEGAR